MIEASGSIFPATFPNTFPLSPEHRLGMAAPCPCQRPIRPDETATNCFKSREPRPQQRSRHRTTDFFSLTTPTSPMRPRRIQPEWISALIRLRYLPSSSPQNHGSDFCPSLSYSMPQFRTSWQRDGLRNRALTGDLPAYRTGSK